jgi:hypothetical protein
MFIHNLSNNYLIQEKLIMKQINDIGFFNNLLVTITSYISGIVGFVTCTGLAYLTFGVAGLVGSLVFDSFSFYLSGEPRGVCSASANVIRLLTEMSMNKHLAGESSEDAEQL